MSGKIKISHHKFFVVAFCIAEPGKAPRKSNHPMDAFWRIPAMKSLSFPANRMSSILIIFSLWLLSFSVSESALK
jgi:hypothetical protein